MKKNRLTVVDRGREAWIIGNGRRMRAIERSPLVKDLILPWDRIPSATRQSVVRIIVDAGGQASVTTGATGRGGSSLVMLCNLWPVFVLAYFAIYPDMDFEFISRD